MGMSVGGAAPGASVTMALAHQQATQAVQAAAKEASDGHDGDADDAGAASVAAPSMPLNFTSGTLVNKTA